MKILVVDAFMPMPERDSGSRRMVGLLHALLKMGHDLTFTAQESVRPPAMVSPLEAQGIRVESVVLPDQKFDIVILSRVAVAIKYLDEARAKWPEALVIFDSVDLQHVREFRHAKLLGNAPLLQRALQVKHHELDICRRVDQVWVVTDTEKRLVENEVPAARVHIVSDPHELKSSDIPFARRSGMIFVGGFLHQPNVDAVQYFASEILPSLRVNLPEADTYIVGSRMPDSIRALASPNLVMVGWLPDLSHLYDQVRVCIAPLRFGAGVKGKVLEAMAFGVPTVASSTALEGVPVESEEDVLVADEPLAFAAAVSRVHSDEELWTRMAQRGKNLVTGHYSPAAVQRQLEGALADTTRT